MKKVLATLALITTLFTNFAFADKVDDYSKLEYTNYYSVVGKAEIKQDLLPTKKDKIKYGKIDELKRPTYVVAIIDYNLVTKEKEEKRQEIKVNPIGWQKKNKKVKIVDGKNEYNGYFYNRSHLLADSLGGSAEYNNLITGTRMQNVGMKNKGGMAYAEIKARDFFKKETKATLTYQVEPIYKDKELLPRYVEINMLSSDGKINEKVVVSNSAKGWVVNYKDGSFKEVGK